MVWPKRRRLQQRTYTFFINKDMVQDPDLYVRHRQCIVYAFVWMIESKTRWNEH